MNNKKYNNLNSSQLFILSLSSICLDDNLYYHSTLYGCRKTPLEKRKLSEKLKTSWQINNYVDLKNTLAWLLEQGYRQDFNKIRYLLSALSELDRNNYLKSLKDLKISSELNTNEYKNFHTEDHINYSKSLIVNYHMKRLPLHGISAYDYACYCYLCRTASMVGYISDVEAWSLMKNIAKVVQKSYSSWNEYITAYAVGYQFKITDITFNYAKQNIDFITKLFVSPKSTIPKSLWDIHL